MGLKKKLRVRLFPGKRKKRMCSALHLAYRILICFYFFSAFNFIFYFFIFRFISVMALAIALHLKHFCVILFPLSTCYLALYSLVSHIYFKLQHPPPFDYLPTAHKHIHTPIITFLNVLCLGEKPALNVCHFLGLEQERPIPLILLFIFSTPGRKQRRSADGSNVEKRLFKLIVYQKKHNFPSRKNITPPHPLLSPLFIVTKIEISPTLTLRLRAPTTSTSNQQTHRIHA